MNGQHSSSSYTVPLYDTTALTSALANPYAQHYAPHYYQAYASSLPRTTTDGYTLSSTYVPGTANQTRSSRPTPTPRNPPPAQTHPQTAVKPIQNHLTYGSWYQPGHSRCTRQGCPFSGSRKSVETHMMDRHFIFPPGWQQRHDWDADPSLKGKPIPIQGTSMVLDTPEAIDAWVAERKRRFPTDARVQEKKRKLAAAAARGQLTPDDMHARARKKYRETVAPAEGHSKGFRGRGYQRGRDRRGHGLARREVPRTDVADNVTNQRTCLDAKCTRETSPNAGPVADEDEAPEAVSSKIPVPSVDVKSAVQPSHAHAQESIRRILHPKKPPRNPFASRSTLLRNLLLPEIRVTVSNLSQAIHFLVDNDFLRDVELRPGEAQECMIEVLDSSETVPEL